MRFLGIDYGTKRVGLAISDEKGVIAFPKEIILNDAKIFGKIEKILQNDSVGGIVVGESVNFGGEPNMLSVRIEIFIKELKKRHSLPIYKEKEFLTTIEARKGVNHKGDANIGGAHSKVKKTKTEKVDASAAALILQRYLDRKNKGTVL